MKYTHRIELNVHTTYTGFTQNLFFTDIADALLAMSAAQTAIEDRRKLVNDRPFMVTFRDALGQFSVDADKITSARMIEMEVALALDTESAGNEARLNALRAGKANADVA